MKKKKEENQADNLYRTLAHSGGFDYPDGAGDLTEENREVHSPYENPLQKVVHPSFRKLHEESGSVRGSVAKSKFLRRESIAGYRNTLYLQGSGRSPKPCKNRKDLNIVYSECTARKAARNRLIVSPDVCSDLSPIEHFPSVRFPQEPPRVQDPLARSPEW